MSNVKKFDYAKRFIESLSEKFKYLKWESSSDEYDEYTATIQGQGSVTIAGSTRFSANVTIYLESPNGEEVSATSSLYPELVDLLRNIKEWVSIQKSNAVWSSAYEILNNL